jgi:hypothetical protein
VRSSVALHPHPHLFFDHFLFQPLWEGGTGVSLWL